jgi:hypothetical protein
VQESQDPLIGDAILDEESPSVGLDQAGAMQCAQMLGGVRSAQGGKTSQGSTVRGSRAGRVTESLGDVAPANAGKLRMMVSLKRREISRYVQ